MTPNRTPSPEQHLHDLTERERELSQSQWAVTVENYRELCEIISTFYKKSDDNHFTGIAELVIEDGMATLKIELVADTTELYRCVDCGLVSAAPSPWNSCITSKLL